MITTGGRRINVEPGLMLTFVLLLLLILGGDGLLMWQFRVAKKASDHLAGVSQEMTSVLRLQASVLTFHQGISQLIETRDAQRLRLESEGLETTLYLQLEDTRKLLTLRGDGVKSNALFSSALESMELSVATQLKTLNSLASYGDWDAVRSRMASKQPIESKAAALVTSVDQESSSEHARSETSMQSIGNRILFLVPASAIATFCIAMFCAWTILRRVVEVRLEERVNERTRLARELHDTLLQGFHGIMLRLQTGVDLIPDIEPAKVLLYDALDRAERVLVEGRNSVQDLRSESSERRDLATDLNRIRGNFSHRITTSCSFSTTGTPCIFKPEAYDEIFAIGREALVNALNHANAAVIIVELEFLPSCFILNCSDDGNGIPTETLLAGRAPRRYGLVGMRERANKMGALLSFSLNDPQGTIVTLKVPARVAYIQSAKRSWWNLLSPLASKKRPGQSDVTSSTLRNKLES